MACGPPFHFLSPLCSFAHGIELLWGPLRALADSVATLRRNECCQARIPRARSSSVPKAHPRDACCWGRCLSFLFSFRLTGKLGLSLQGEEEGSKITWTTREQQPPPLGSGVLRECAWGLCQLLALAEEMCLHSQGLFWSG